jgi:hypothetical protein
MTAPPPPGPRSDPLLWFLAALLAVVGGVAIVVSLALRTSR